MIQWPWYAGRKRGIVTMVLGLFLMVVIWLLLRGGVIDISPGSEKYRYFVGDNPDSCIQYIDTMLVSYPCFGLISDANTHLPASASLPTYTIKKEIVTSDGYIQGFAYSKYQNIVLLRHPAAGELPAYYSITSLQGDLSSRSGAVLTSLDATKAYFIKAYGEGLVVYSSDLSQAYYNKVAPPGDPSQQQLAFYPGLSSELEKISLAKPNDKNLQPISLDVSDKDTVLTLHASSEKKTSEIIINSPGGSKNIKLKETVSKALLCGGNRLCVIGQKGMGVYDISSGKPRHLFGLAEAADIMQSKHGFLVVNKKGVLNLNTETHQGFYEYTFGSYAFNAIQLAPDGYILSLTDNKQRRVALYVKQADADNDAIDRKIADLQKLTEIKRLSIYDKYIFISPDLGSLVYDSTSENYTYNPLTKKKVNTKINQEIDRLGIDRKVYSIVNTSEETGSNSL